METAVKYYKGRVDVIYLYSNKDFTRTSNAYIGIEKLLSDCDISLVPITNQNIFDVIIANEYSIIKSYYFNNTEIRPEWFQRNLDVALKNLEPRYNSNFNVELEIEDQLELFCCTTKTLSGINNRKHNVAELLEKLRKDLPEYATLYDDISEKVIGIADVTFDTIYKCMTWKDVIGSSFSDELAKYRSDVDALDDFLQEDILSVTRVKDTSKSASERFNDTREARRIKLVKMIELANALDILEFNKSEISLIKSHVLVVNGEAGAGKSHLLGNIAASHLMQGGYSLLLLGQNFLTSETIEQQISSQLGVAVDFTEFLETLECLGCEKDKNIVFFIDAINESSDKRIWKSGLLSFVETVSAFPHLKIILSIRNSYEELVFNERIRRMIDSKDIASCVHYGFNEKPIAAIERFFDFYNIVLRPTEFLWHELTNPLLLMLYCKTVGERPSHLYALFDKYLMTVDADIKCALNQESSINLLQKIVNEIADVFIDCGQQNISERKLLSLPFWNAYGLDSDKIKYIDAMKRNGFLSAGINRGDSEEYYYFAYQTMADYYTAARLLARFDNGVELKRHIVSDLLKIENGVLNGNTNRGIFTVLSGLYPDKFDGECMDVINGLTDEHDIKALKRDYINSFSLRNPLHIDPKYFLDFVFNNASSGDIDAMFDVFFATCLTENHPLNAEMLHNMLSLLELNFRDFIWTTRINHFSEDDRIWYIMKRIQKGDKFEGMTSDERSLFAIFLTWLLTSSNRFLRDAVSEALIELLKDDFSLCLSLLKMFQSVNDPYVIQRLYGVVFGACMKRGEEYKDEYCELALFVDRTIFAEDIVLPDILLRDYARLIVARFLYEYPEYNSKFRVERIRPPYKSGGIPIVPQDEYYVKDRNNWGMNAIDNSMQSTFGDFGKYIFRAAIKRFENSNEAAIENMRHYAMQFIRDSLKYRNDYFNEYDSARGRASYLRHDSKKIERIGKKYQWIALHRILALLADSSKVESEIEYGIYDRLYSGAWNLYIRDFDPTLNIYKMNSPNVPVLSKIVDFDTDWFVGEISADAASVWANEGTSFFTRHVDKLQFTDTFGMKWIMLGEYSEQNNGRDTETKLAIINNDQRLWSKSHSYIISATEFERIRDKLMVFNFRENNFPAPISDYHLYNREYVWASSYIEKFDDYWMPVEIETGEIEVSVHSGMLPVFNEDPLDSEFITFEEQEYTTERKLTEHIASVMPTYINYCWETEYDASQDASVSFSIPNKDIIDKNAT